MTKKKIKKLRIDSAKEAVEAIENFIHGFEKESFEITEKNMIELRELIRQIWEDAYVTGRADEYQTWAEIED